MSETPEQPQAAAPESTPPQGQPVADPNAQANTLADADPQEAAAQNPLDNPVVGSDEDSVAHDPDLVQVMVDQWGHRGEFIKNMILRISEIDPAHYDIESALTRGVLRRLTRAEARPESLPAARVLDERGQPDLLHEAAMRFHSGITGDIARTVTTEQGPAEPAEFAKPTLPGPENNQPAARPVVVAASAVEAETEGMRASRVVPTSRGPVYAEDVTRAGRGRRASDKPQGGPTEG